MEDEKIIKYIKETPENRKNMTILASLNILIQAMIKKGWFTETEYNNVLEETIDNFANMYIKNLNEEERKNLEAQIQITEDPLFGKFFKDYI